MKIEIEEEINGYIGTWTYKIDDHDLKEYIVDLVVETMEARGQKITHQLAETFLNEYDLWEDMEDSYKADIVSHFTEIAKYGEE